MWCKSMSMSCQTSNKNPGNIEISPFTSFNFNEDMMINRETFTPSRNFLLTKEGAYHP